MDGGRERAFPFCLPTEVHVRDNAEAIAFYQGEQKESDVVKEPMHVSCGGCVASCQEPMACQDKLRAAIQNYDQVIQWTTGLTFYQKVFFYAHGLQLRGSANASRVNSTALDLRGLSSEVARLVPYFVVGGLYFAGKVDFGTFGQVSFAFSMVLRS